MTQIWKASDYREKGNFVPVLGMPLIELLNPKPGMRILDVGCGNGVLTEKLVASGADVYGIDFSQDMVEAAKKLGLDVQVMNALDMSFENEFDAVFSNAALHWMTENPQRIVENIFRALKPGGIFVGEMGGKGNIAEIERCQQLMLEPYGLDLHQISPKFFPDEHEYRGLLEASGFEIVMIDRFERPTALPDGVSGWLTVFANATLDALSKEDVPTFLKDVENCTKAKLFDPTQSWLADYVRLRFKAKKP